MQLSIFSSAELPAKASASPDFERDWLIRVATSCSPILPLLSATLPAGWYGKTSPVSCHQTADGTLEPCSAAWQNSGMGSPTAFLTLSSSEWPSAAVVCSLSDILEIGDVPQRYFLSAKACSGIPAPSREARQGIAPTLSARTRGGGGLGTDFDCDGGLIPQIARALTTSNQRIDAETETETETLLVAHSLRAEGFDASEDGTGRGTPLVPCEPYTLAIRGRDDGHMLEYRQDGTANAILTPNGGRGGIGVGAIAFAENSRAELRLEGGDGQRVGAISTGGGKPGQGIPMIAMGFDCKASGQNGFGVGEIASTMRSMGHANSHQNGGGHLAVAFQCQGSNVGEMGTLRKGNGNVTGGVPFAQHGPAVRRLTPRECERLQGFPDDYTHITVRGKPAADGPRYKALGNSMAVPVMRWIGERIELVESLTT